jgi:hypothetical protein
MPSNSVEVERRAHAQIGPVSVQKRFGGAAALIAEPAKKLPLGQHL